MVSRKRFTIETVTKPFRARLCGFARASDIQNDGGPMQLSTIGTRWCKLAPYLHALLRIVAALMFLLIGSAKLFAFPFAMGPGGHVPYLSELGLAGALEFFGGILLLIGLYTRPVAFILSGEMAVAYFQAHFPKGFWPMANGGLSAVLYCFLWLYFSAAGAGAWSLDSRRGK